MRLRAWLDSCSEWEKMMTMSLKSRYGEEEGDREKKEEEEEEEGVGERERKRRRLNKKRGFLPCAMGIVRTLHFKGKKLRSAMEVPDSWERARELHRRKAARTFANLQILYCNSTDQGPLTP